MNDFPRLARTAGLLYLVIIVCGISSEVFVRGSLVVANDATATAANIIASPGLFRLGFALDALMLLCDVAIAVLFYVLLNPVNHTLSLTAAAFRLTQASVLGLNLLNYHAAQLLLQGEQFSVVFGQEQLNALASLFLQLHSYGYDLGLLFFGVSTLVLGSLMVQASYFPSALGYGLIAAALVYLAGSVVRFLLPEQHDLVQPFYIVPLIAELSACLWLLVKGGTIASNRGISKDWI